MRIVFVSLTALIVAVMPALALGPQDNMGAWNSASSADKDRFLAQMQKSSDTSKTKDEVLSCLNDAGRMSAHSNLLILDVFKACSEQKAGEKI